MTSVKILACTFLGVKGVTIINYANSDWFGVMTLSITASIAFILSAIMLNVVMLNVILLSVVAPLNHTFAFVVSNGGYAFSALSFLNPILSLFFYRCCTTNIALNRFIKRASDCTKKELKGMVKPMQQLYQFWKSQSKHVGARTLSIMTTSIKGWLVTLSITSHYHYAECRYVECRILLMVLLNVVAPVQMSKGK